MFLNKIFYFIAMLIIIVGLEMVFSYHFGLMNFMPDLFLLFVVFYAWFYQERKGQFAGFFIGIIRDVFGIGVFGSHMLIFTITGHVIGRIVKIINAFTESYSKITNKINLFEFGSVELR